MIVGIREIPHELVERVESGTGEDRSLESDIAELFNPDRFKPEYVRGQARRYTSSLDAVVFLIEQKLPGWCWQVKRGIGCEAIVWQVCKDYDDEGCKTTGFHMSSAPRALLAACLRAIQAQAGTLADAHSKNPPEAERHG